METKVVALTNNHLLIAQIEEVPAAVPGEPDCKLTEPFIINDDGTLSPWLLDITTQNTFMISSDKILTLVQPNSKLVKKYEDVREE